MTGLWIGLAGTAGLLVPGAHADTIATFADPASDGSTPLFWAAADVLGGGWDGLGLDLVTPITGETYHDATFTMTELTFLDPYGTVSGGTIEFFESVADGGSLILRIDFDEARSGPFGFGASEWAGQDLAFSGPIISIPLEDESFAFAFANPVMGPDGVTWTAAFTSSAILEPATLTLLAFGGVALGVARRRA